MTTQEFAQWAQHVTHLLPMNNPDAAKAWFDLARKRIGHHTLADAREAVDAVVVGVPGYPTDWLGKINAELQKAVDKRIRAEMEEDGFVDYEGPTCIVCSNSGLVDLPHRKHVSPQGVWLRCARSAVYCECGYGNRRLHIDQSNDLRAHDKALQAGKRPPEPVQRITTKQYTEWLMRHTGMDDVAAKEWWYPVPHPKCPKAYVMRQDLIRYQSREVEQEAEAVEKKVRQGPRIPPDKMVAELMRRFAPGV